MTVEPWENAFTSQQKGREISLDRVSLDEASRRDVCFFS